MKEWRAILVLTLLGFSAIFFIAWMGSAPTIHYVVPADGEEAACEFPESIISDALKQEPDKIVVKLNGKMLETFLSRAQAADYLSGSLPSLASLYIIRGAPLDILFFINAYGCIVSKVSIPASIVEALFWGATPRPNFEPRTYTERP